MSEKDAWDRARQLPWVRECERQKHELAFIEDFLDPSIEVIECGTCDKTEELPR